MTTPATTCRRLPWKPTPRPAVPRCKRFVVTLEAADDPLGWRDAEYRLKLFLKRAGREWGLRCVAVGVAASEESETKEAPAA